MKQFTVLFLMVLFVAGFGNSYVKFWENGSEQTGHAFLSQGNMVAWEADVNQPGNRLQFIFYIDYDSSLTISEGDKMLDFFWIGDGEPGNDGPGDSSLVPDGIVYVELGPLGFPAGNYILKAIDEDLSSSFIPFHVAPLQDPPAVVTGLLSVDGLSLPSLYLKDLFVGATGLEEFNGFWMGRVDEYGNVTVPYPNGGDSVEVGMIFEKSGHKKLILPDTGFVVETHQPTGPIVAPDITLDGYIANAKVYGQLRDDDNVVLTGMLKSVRLENEDNQLHKNWYIDEAGNFEVYMYCDGSNIVRLNVEEEEFSDIYMMPSSWENPNYRFSISPGDSLQRNITLVKADTAIFVRIIEQGGDPTMNYYAQAFADTLGVYKGKDVSSSITRIPVSSKEGQYWINLADWDEYQLPPEYVVIPQQGVPAGIGDTVTFQVFIPDGYLAVNTEVNSISSWPDFYNYQVMATDLANGSKYVYEFNGSSSVMMPVLNGSYQVNLSPIWNTVQESGFMIEPMFESPVTISNDTVDVVYTLHEAFAMVDVIIHNYDVTEPFSYMVSDTGNVDIYPGDITVTDTIFSYHLGAGDWLFHAPLIPGDQGNMSPADTIIHISYDNNYHVLHFNYEPPVGIGDKPISYSYQLEQNYPNPFNPVTKIPFQLSQKEKVYLSIYNILGEKVMDVLDGMWMAEGNHDITVDMSRIPSGIYIYKLRAGKFTSSKKMILIK
ncbi:MAG: hypothetical protein Kow00108_12130 [Calditrichia bacterium]